MLTTSYYEQDVTPDRVSSEGLHCSAASRRTRTRWRLKLLKCHQTDKYSCFLYERTSISTPFKPLLLYALNKTLPTHNEASIEHFPPCFWCPRTCLEHVERSTDMTSALGCLTSSIKCIYNALFTSADVTKCYTEIQPKTPNRKQCRCRSTVARKNSLERPKPRKKPR